MLNPFKLIGLAILVGVLVTLGCILLGSILLLVDSGLTLILGKFLQNWCTLLGIVAGMWFYLARTLLR